MSTMEPDEGAEADDQRTEPPRWEKTEAANPPDDADGSDASDVSSTDS